MRQKHTFLSVLLTAFVLCSQSLSAQVISTFAGDGFGAGTGTGGYSGDGGVPLSARLNQCTAVTFDGAGNIYIADRNNNVIRKVSYTGIISTFAGTGTPGYSGDTLAATAAKLNMPYGVASDMPGNVYIADYNNNVVRKVSTTGKITTYAGTGIAGYSGNGGAATAAKLHSPQAIAVDQYDNVYVAEAGNHIIRKISASGVITTVAGNGTYGYSGNGGNATLAQLYGPAGVTVDVYGNIYIADYFNNVVRKVDTFGIINNYAGNHTVGNGGDGGKAVNAQLYLPSGVSIFGHGNVYIADQGNNLIRKVDDSGIITRVAGTTTSGYSGDGGSAIVAQLASPKGLAVDGIGRLYIADYDNNVIRLVNYPVGIRPVAQGEAGMDVYPNPSQGTVTVQLPETTTTATITIADIMGRVVATQKMDRKTQVNFNLNDLPAGSYFIKAVTRDKIYKEQLLLVK